MVGKGSSYVRRAHDSEKLARVPHAVLNGTSWGGFYGRRGRVIVAAEGPMRPLATIAALALAACSAPGSEDIETCEAKIADMLVAPSTYRRIAATVSGSIVEIEFDAQNPMGVPLRHHATCIGDSEPFVRKS